MAQEIKKIDVVDLAVKDPALLDSNDQVVMFTQDGDTNRMAFSLAVSEANNQNGCACIRQAKVTITSAQLLSINFTPIQIIPASAGSFIEVVSASVSIDFNTMAYNTNTNLILLPSGGEKILESDVLGLTSVTSLDTIKFTSVQGTTPRDVAINVSVETDSPIGGDSDITVYVTYREITP